jgi:hypothetical protein
LWKFFKEPRIKKISGFLDAAKIKGHEKDVVTLLSELEKIVRFIDISLEDGTMTDIPLPPLNADETSKISYRYNPSEIHHYQSDYFEFTLSYMEAQPSALSIDKTQKIQLFRRSSIGPPLPSIESK